MKAGRASTVGTAALFESQDGYVTDLLSYSLDRLTKEPELLHVDGEQLQRQLQEVAVGHYRSFITAAECVEVRCSTQFQPPSASSVRPLYCLCFLSSSNSSYPVVPTLDAVASTLPSNPHGRYNPIRTSLTQDES